MHIDAAAATTPFPHFWELGFGSGRAAEVLRADYLQDVDAVKAATDFQYVRFHAILHDELGVYTEDENGKPVYNFSLVDRIYDSLLKRGVRPIVEISFMPRKLAFNPDALHAFWYRPDISPPKDMRRWDALMKALAGHLVARYGLDEVAKWYFEVWNEPNIDFWNGVPAQGSYFDLYAHTARDLKAVSPRLRVGGPATSAAYWITDFLKYTAREHVPVDFISTHGYADDSTQDYFGNDIPMPQDERVCKAISKVRGEIRASATPNLPLFWTEWNVQGAWASRDTIFVGPALANTIRQCDGNVDLLSFWTFTDVFEEGGPIARPFEGHFGIRAKDGINKPSFYAFSLLHQLGSQRIASASEHVIATKRTDGTLALAAWNIVDPSPSPEQKAHPEASTPADAGILGPATAIDLHFEHCAPDAWVEVQRVDATHGNVLPVYHSLGAPDDPTEAQVAEMNRRTALGAPARMRLQAGTLHLALTANTLALITLRP